MYKKPIYYILLFTFLLSINSMFAQSKKTVLFDENHGQLFLTGKTGELDLSKLAALFQKEGWIVKALDVEITDEVLEGVDALVISGAFKPLSPKETATILRFLEKGGKLCVMLHIRPPVADLLHALNVSVSNGVMHEVGERILNNDIEFKVVDLKPHELTNKLKEFNVYGAWALLPTKENGQIIAQTSAKAWIDLNGDKKPDAQQAFAVFVTGSYGPGQFAVFSDDAMFQNKFLTGNNYLLGQNLAEWLKK